MLFRTPERSPSIGIGSSIAVAILGTRGKSVQFGLSGPSEISIRREAAEPSDRIEARQQLTCDVRRLINDALLSGRPLREVEDYLDGLENTCRSAKPA
jgi:sRNA-binding carbon storage regulator CsrA